MSYLLQSLLICTITMSCVAAVLLAMSPLLLSRYNAKTVYIAWMVVLLGFVIPFRPQLAPAAITVPVGQMNRVNVFSREPKMPNGQALQKSTAQGAQPASVGTANLSGDMQTDDTVQSDEALTAPIEAAAPSVVLSLSMLITILWITGALGTLCYRLLLHYRFMKTVRRWRKPVTNPAYLQLFSVTLDQLGIQKKIKLMKCKPIDTPMLIGIWSPCILLPDEDMALSALQLVLRHELIHYKRHDLLGKVLMLITSAMYWFNPLMPLIASAMSFQCEAACDDEVMRDTSLDTRMYYSETILQMVRKQNKVNTALSTCYRGTKRSMRKRIMSILNDKRKKLGPLLVALILVTVLCTGMTLALGATFSKELEQEILQAQTNYYSWWGDFQNYEDTGNAQAKLAALINQYHTEVEAKDPALLGACISMDLPWKYKVSETIAQLDACQNADDLLAFLASDSVEVIEEREGIDRYVTEVLRAAGHGDMPYRVYSKYKLDPSLFPKDMEIPEGTNIWVVCASGNVNPETKKRPTTYLYALEDFKVSVLNTSSFRYTPSIREMTEEERQTVKERALSFTDTYVLMLEEPADTVLVSDYVFEDTLPEPYTYVWRSNFSIDKKTENVRELFESPEEVQFHRGLEIVVGLETGTIYDVSQYIPLTSFVHVAQAEKDWKALTGLEYPFFYNGNLYETIFPWIENKMYKLHELYGQDLSMQEQVDYESMQYVSGNGLVLDNVDWTQLVMDMDACSSAASFKRLIQRGHETLFGRISPADEQIKKEFQAKADAFMDGIGHGDYQCSATQSLIQNEERRYTFYYAHKDELQKSLNNSLQQLVYTDTDGLTFFYNRNFSNNHGIRSGDIAEDKSKLDLTEEQRAFATERAVFITDTVLGVSHMQDEPIFVKDKVFKITTIDVIDYETWDVIENEIELFAHVWVPVRTVVYDENSSYPVPYGQEPPYPDIIYGYEIDVGLETGKIYGVNYCTKDEADVPIYYM